MQIETERKFLIAYPDVNALEKIDGFKKMEMVQTYLLAEKGVTSRVRKVVTDKETKYIRTEKRRISQLSAFEDESEISREEYEDLLLIVNRALKPIIKTRYSFPHNDHIIEIDIYPFWNDRAILEIEIKNENDRVEVPLFIRVIKEVTGDMRYKNVNLARNIPLDEI